MFLCLLDTRLLKITRVTPLFFRSPVPSLRNPEGTAAIRPPIPSLRSPEEAAAIRTPWLIFSFDLVYSITGEVRFLCPAQRKLQRNAQRRGRARRLGFKNPRRRLFSPSFDPPSLTAPKVLYFVSAPPRLAVNIPCAFQKSER